MLQSDPTTIDLTEAQPRIKDGLKYTVQHTSNGCWYLIEDESRGQFFRVGESEYTLLSMLDGKTTIANAIAETCSVRGSDALDEQEAINLCKWALESELAHTSQSTSAARIQSRKNNKSALGTIQKINPVSFRVPLFELDQISAHLNGFFGWLFSRSFFLVWLVVVMAGVFSLATSLDKLHQVEVFSRDGMLWLLVTWCVLKIVHECGHMIACKRFGGTVGRGGILFLLLIPMPYVDVSSSWRFTSKTRRILTSAAGMMVEVFLAAIAMMVWSSTDPGPLNFVAANVMISASIHTLLFNANPLMRFDGYHILADLTEIPNLGNHGQSYVQGKLNQWFFGKSSQFRHGGFQGILIRIYGVAAQLWKISLTLTIAIAAANLLPGLGLFIACGSILLWIAMPGWRLVRYLVKGTQFDQPNRRQFATAVTLIGIFVFCLGRLIPAPSVFQAPIVVDYEEIQPIRCAADGIVTQTAELNDQWVEKGTLIMQLENPELEQELVEAEAELKASEIKVRKLRNHHQIAEAQAEEQLLLARRKHYQQVRQKTESLAIRAPCSGILLADRLDEMKGRWVQTGQELFSVASPRLNAVAMLSQNKADYLNSINHSWVQLKIWGLPGSLSAGEFRVDPHSQDDLPHFAFAGSYGGPLDVVERANVEQLDPEQQQLNASQFKLVSPHVRIQIQLDEKDATRLRSGQTGLACFRGRNQSFGQYVWDGISRWFRNKIEYSHGI